MLTDILMVWHAYQLNPLDYLEDSLRLKKMSIWHTDFPWQAIHDCFGHHDSNYSPSTEAHRYFQDQTSQAWDNLDDPSTVLLPCPNASPKVEIEVPWTTWSNQSKSHEKCRGFADKGFTNVCSHCDVSVDRNALSISNFRDDIALLRAEGIPLRGSCLNTTGEYIQTIVFFFA